MRALADLGPRTEATILKAVYKSPYPRMALPDIALNHGLLLTDLQALLNKHGYPTKGTMLKNAQRLERLADQADQAAAAAPTPAPAPPDTAADSAAGDTAADGRPRDRLMKIRVDHLHADPDNVREDLGDVDELAASIDEAGLLQPIIARRDGDKIMVLAGHRRLAAVRKLGWLEVDVVVKAPMRPAHIIAAMLIENGQRKDLDPIEEARGLQRLKVEGNLSDADVARMVGRTGVHVGGRLALLSLSPEEQEEVRRGAMTLTEAKHKGRMASGRVGKTGLDRNWHLGPQHDLAELAKNRCQRANHGRGRTVGGMACGACWESVIRADEKKHLQEYAIRTGTCSTCGGTHERTQP